MVKQVLAHAAALDDGVDARPIVPARGEFLCGERKDALASAVRVAHAGCAGCCHGVLGRPVAGRGCAVSGRLVERVEDAANHVDDGADLLALDDQWW